VARGDGVHEWRHNWIPLTPSAALIKAHGSRTGAASLMRRHHIKGKVSTRELVRRSKQTSLPDRPSVHDRGRADVAASINEAAAARRSSAELRQLSDDQLADRLADVGDDDAALDQVLKELDRRDRAAQAAKRRTEARKAARDAKERAKESDFDRRLAAGEDPEAAYAAAYGIDVERLRRDEAIASLRSSGYAGRNFDELARNAFADHAYESWLNAEAETNGYLVNKAGERAKVDPRSLFLGPESRARKYASEELLRYWQTHGRLTVDDFRASLLGGAMRSKSTAAWS
jgi:hypothetical protein